MFSPWFCLVTCTLEMAFSSTKTMLHLGYFAFVLTSSLVAALSEPGVPHIPGQSNVCLGHICLNGGHCVDNSGQATCACVPGVSGVWCENVEQAPVKDGKCPIIQAEPSGKCRGTLCSNDAVCPKQQKCCPTSCATKVCAQPEGLAVKPTPAPLTPPPCTGYICMNGGTCQVSSAGVPSCQCVEGFSGARCEVTIKAVIKPGQCPVIKADPVGKCDGTVCANDAVCPGDHKCCQTECSTTVCAGLLTTTSEIADTTSSPETTATPRNSVTSRSDVACANVRCRAGTSCLMIRSSAQTNGIPTCVLDADRTCWASGFERAVLINSRNQPGGFDSIPCGRRLGFNLPCPSGSTCSQGEIVRSGICCKGVLNTDQAFATGRSAQIKNACGGCPDRQMCITLPVECVGAPCSPFNLCVPESQGAKCPLPCPRGHTCQMLQMPDTPRPVCVADAKPTAPLSNPACPPTRRGGATAIYLCRLIVGTSHVCTSDMDCAGPEPGICCPTECGANYCINQGGVVV